jgi:hypothetical protein
MLCLPMVAALRACLWRCTGTGAFVGRRGGHKRTAYRARGQELALLNICRPAENGWLRLSYAELSGTCRIYRRAAENVG